MASADGPVALVISVAYSPCADVVDEVAVGLPVGATVHDAIQASGVLQRHREIDLNRQRIGVWGRFKALQVELRDGDRVEIYRPLQVDPKQARRERCRKQRVKR